MWRRGIWRPRIESGRSKRVHCPTMAGSTIHGRGPAYRLLRQLAGPLQGVVDAVSGCDLNVVVITSATVMLCGIGLLSIYTTESGGTEGTPFTVHQGTYVIASLAVMVLVSMVDYRRWGPIVYPAFGATMMLLALLLAAKVLNRETFLIRPSHGAWRWINLGPFQAAAERVRQDHLRDGPGVVPAVPDELPHAGWADLAAGPDPAADVPDPAGAGSGHDAAAAASLLRRAAGGRGETAPPAEPGDDLRGRRPGPLPNDA